MWLSTAPISLIRYLIAWRVHAPLVRLPTCLPAAISTVLGTLVAERLPTQQARPWRKALAGPPGQAAGVRLAASNWPIEGMIFFPPGKRTYGMDEIIPWELKLLGPHADHGLFLELILPAIEAAAVTRDPRWFANYSLWGRFAVQSIFVAKGARWEPLAEDGRLNLNLRPSAAQWAEGLWSAGQPERTIHHIRWVTPFAFDPAPTAPVERSQAPGGGRTIAVEEVPSLERMVEACLRRLATIAMERRAPVRDPWSLLEPAERDSLQAALATPAALRKHTFVQPPKGWPGNWIGEQVFAAPIPIPLLPYLNLAAILHIGDFTHYGCGTFRLK